MTLHLNFSDKAKQEQLQILGIWLKEMDLVKSYAISNLTFDDTEPKGEPDTDSFVENMLSEVIKMTSAMDRSTLLMKQKNWPKTGSNNSRNIDGKSAPDICS